MIIGLTGNKGVGKDTAGAYLVEKYGFERISFADKLKESAAAIFNIDREKWEKLKNDKTSFVTVGYYNTESEYPGGGEVATITVREFLQRYGTEAHREVFGDNFWIHAAFDKLYSTKSYLKYDYVITDVRFKNEANSIRMLGGKVIEIKRDTKEQDNHISEAGIPTEMIDGVILNNGSLENLYGLLDAVMIGNKNDSR